MTTAEKIAKALDNDGTRYVTNGPSQIGMAEMLAASDARKIAQGACAAWEMS